ncbi:MAG TPA: hypothetical protein VGG03_03360 [Thermoanaerobaculia bacterium]
MDVDSPGRQGERDQSGADAELQRPPAAGELRQGVDGGDFKELNH